MISTVVETTRKFFLKEMNKTNSCGNYLPSAKSVAASRRMPVSVETTPPAEVRRIKAAIKRKHSGIQEDCKQGSPVRSSWNSSTRTGVYFPSITRACAAMRSKRNSTEVSKGGASVRTPGTTDHTINASGSGQLVQHAKRIRCVGVSRHQAVNEVVKGADIAAKLTTAKLRRSKCLLLPVKNLKRLNVPNFVCEPALINDGAGEYIPYPNKAVKVALSGSMQFKVNSPQSGMVGRVKPVVPACFTILRPRRVVKIPSIEHDPRLKLGRFSRSIISKGNERDKFVTIRKNRLVAGNVNVLKITPSAKSVISSYDDMESFRPVNPSLVSDARDSMLSLFDSLSSLDLISPLAYPVSIKSISKSLIIPDDDIPIESVQLGAHESFGMLRFLLSQ